MPLPVIQPSFATGELSPSLFGRVDLAKFHAGAALLRNFFVDYRGGASNRAGTAYVGPCLPGINRAIGFSFSTLQTYALVFSDRAMRVVMNGGLVLEPTVYVMTGFFNTFPMKWQGVTPLVAGDWVFVLVNGGPVNGNTPSGGNYATLAGRFFQVISNAANILTLADTNGAPFDASYLPALGNGGFICRVFTLTTPYAAADLALLKFTQSADTMTLCHPSYPPQALTRTDHAAWTITPISFVPTLASPAITGVAPSLPGDHTLYTYVVTAMGANGVTESLPSAPVTSTDSKTMSTTPGAFQTVAWTAPVGPAPQLYNVYRQGEVPGSAASAGQLFGFVGTCTGLSFADHNIAPDFTRCPPQDPGILAAANSYPACTTYYQQRQVFAATNNNPQTLYGSKTGDFYNMEYSVPSRPNDAIIATLVSRQVNAIKHLIPMDAMLAFTSNGAWKIDAGSQGGPITPGAIDATAQAYNGCSDVPPVVVNRDVLYVQAKGSAVRDLAYNDFVKIYTGTDLSVLASHLFAGHQILEWAYAEEPHKLIWCVRDDGVVLIFTYLKEQEVYAWTHAITGGQFKSVCTISEGAEDAVYFIVQRKIRGVYVQYIERLASRLLGDNPELGVPADFTRFRFADCALSTALIAPAATLYPNDGAQQPAGGWWTTPHLIGASVTVGGVGYTAPQAVIDDPTGTGAIITLTVLGGVITVATVTAKGVNYTRPMVRVVDATGAGADVRAQLGREMELISDLPVLTGVQVGSLFVGNGGYGFVLANNSSRSITVDMQQQLANDFPIPAGKWSVTPKVATVHGLDHLEGREVVILADGNVQPNQTVVQGAVALQTPAAAVTVGLAYTARLESLYADVPGESPTVQGRRKLVSEITVRTANTRGLKVGTKGGGALQEFKERDTDLMGDPITAYTGDRRIRVESTIDEAGQVILQQDLPLPATILALIPNVSVGDTPG